MTALFMTTIPMSGVIGSPLSGWIMQSCAGVNGWAGWQWLFLLEGAPTILIGVVVWFYLDDGIDAAKLLSPSEKRLLTENIQQKNIGKTTHSFKNALGSGKV